MRNRRNLYICLLLTLLGYAQILSAQIAVPTRNEVGPDVMPDTIAPIIAPFEMPQLQRPTFPDLRMSIVEQGARPGEFVRSEIQAAIDAVAERGGGTVIIPEGDWKTGRIELRSNVCLHLEEGARLYFSGEVKDYLPVVFCRTAGVEVMSTGAMIYAYNQRNIAITGKGRLIGPTQQCELWNRSKNYGSFDQEIDYSLPPSERIYDGRDSSQIFLPTFIGPVACQHVLIEGVELSDCVFWNIVPTYCDSVIIRGTSVHSLTSLMGDGIDVESSNHVLIEYNFMETGDDNYTLKAGRGEDGLRVARPCQNIVLRRNRAAEGHGGVTIGSESAGTIRNVYACDNVFDGTRVGLRFKTRRPRGGGGENLYYERNRISVQNEAISFDMLGSPSYVGNLSQRQFMEPDRFTPMFRDVMIRDVVVERARTFLKVQGIPESPANNLLIERADAHCQNSFLLHDLDQCLIRQVSLQVESPEACLLDARNLIFEQVVVEVPGDRLHWQIEGGLVDKVFWNGEPINP